MDSIFEIVKVDVKSSTGVPTGRYFVISLCIVGFIESFSKKIFVLPFL